MATIPTVTLTPEQINAVCDYVWSLMHDWQLPTTPSSSGS
jgi:hypothetical protein